MPATSDVKTFSKLWSTAHHIKKPVKMPDLNRLPVGIGIIPGPNYVDIYTLLDLPVGHFRYHSRVVSPARAYRVFPGGELPRILGPPLPYKNVDWGYRPFVPNDCWLDKNTFQGRVVAPRSGLITKAEANGLSYSIDDIPVVEFDRKHRAKVTAVAQTGEVVEQGDVLCRFEGELVGRKFMSGRRPGPDMLDCRTQPEALRVFARLDELMLVHAIFTDDRWEKYHPAIEKKVEWLGHRQNRNGMCGRLGKQLLGQISAPTSKLLSFETAKPWQLKVVESKGFVFDLDGWDNESQAYLKLVPRERWDQFLIDAGDVLLDLTPGDRRFSVEAIPKESLLAQKKASRKKEKKKVA